MVVDPKISIIMPTYNSENWLNKSVPSVLNQTYKNIELICIDDCSTDNTISIIKRFQETDNRVVLIQKEQNSGPGVSRNIGLEKATGKYVAFIDSDDTYELDGLETLYQLLTKYNTKAVFANWYIDISDKSIEQKYYKDALCIPDKKASAFFISPWGKLIDLEFIRTNNIKFGEGFVAEDRVFQIELLANLDELYLSQKHVYHWNRNNENSVTTTNFNKGKTPRSVAYLSVAEKCIEIMKSKKASLFNPEYEIESFYRGCLTLPLCYFKQYYNQVWQIIQHWDLSKSDFDKRKNFEKYKQLKSRSYIKIFFGTKVRHFKRNVVLKIKALLCEKMLKRGENEIR